MYNTSLPIMLTLVTRESGGVVEKFVKRRQATPAYNTASVETRYFIIQRKTARPKQKSISHPYSNPPSLLL